MSSIQSIWADDVNCWTVWQLKLIAKHKWNRAAVVVNFTLAFPATTRQNIHSEKGLAYYIRILYFVYNIMFLFQFSIGICKNEHTNAVSGKRGSRRALYSLSNCNYNVLKWKEDYGVLSRWKKKKSKYCPPQGNNAQHQNTVYCVSVIRHHMPLSCACAELCDIATDWVNTECHTNEWIINEWVIPGQQKPTQIARIFWAASV